MDKLQTLQSLVETLSAHSDQVVMLALHKGGIERWSYAELADYVQRLAHGLATAGVGCGQTVALLADNRPAWIIACLAALKAGAVVVPLDMQFGSQVLGHVLHDSGARVIFTTAEASKRLEGLDTEVPMRPIVLDVEADDERSWRRLLTDRAGELPHIEREDPAALFYTSGTTGPPKGVPLTHGHLVFQLHVILAADLVRQDDRLLLPLPLHHVYPFVMGLLAPLALGLPIVMPQSLTGQQIMRALQEGRATVVIGVPRLYSALYAAMEAQAAARGCIAAALLQVSVSLSTALRRQLGLRLGKLLLRPLHQRFGPKLRLLASGGAALAPDLAWKLQGLGWQVATGYGLTETAPLLTWNLPGAIQVESAGRPIPGVEIRIDPSAQPEAAESREAHSAQGARPQGEILARGPNVFAGYHNLPEKTAEVFTADGWFRTGDLGYVDDEGYLHVLGRVSTLIVTPGGNNIQPEDVEDVYLESPVIREIGVLQQDGQLVAVIVPERREIRRHGNGEMEQTLRGAVAERSQHLPSYQRIADYAVTYEPLSRTHLGKIRRHLLPDRYAQAKQGKDKAAEVAAGPMSPQEMSDADRALLEQPVAKQVWDWLARRYADRRLTPETSPQLDLGIDSLEWLNLTLEIGQHTGVELSDEAIGRIDTVRDLLREVAEHAEAGTAMPRVSPLEQPEEVLSERQKRWLTPLGPIMSVLAWGLFALNWAVMHGLFRLRVQGLEHLPEQSQWVLAPNHASYLDPFALAAALGFRRLRQTYWGGWTGVAFSNPLNRLVSRLAQAVPIDAPQAVLASLAFGAAVLKRRQNLIWFPEGQRSPTGELQPFKPGIGMLLNHFPVPVVPVYIHGTYAALPTNRSLPRVRQIRVIFGQPLHGPELEQQGEGDEPHDRIVHALHDRVAALGSQKGARDGHS